MEHNKYHDSKIYKLTNTIDDNIYIGSTIESLNTRFNKHKSHRNVYGNRKVYQHFNAIGWDNVNIELIANIRCENFAELIIEEDRHIVLLNPSLNEKRARRTPEQYRIDNAAKIHEYTNLESTKQRKKEYLNENKEYFKEQKKEYVEKNKAAILEWRNTKRDCVCGVQYTNANILRHNLTKRHTEFILNN